MRSRSHLQVRTTHSTVSQLRNLRTRLGLSQRQIAERLNLDPSIVQLWESGKRPIPASRLKAYADALEVSPADIPSHALAPSAPTTSATPNSERILSYRAPVPTPNLNPIGRCADPECHVPNCMRFRCTLCDGYTSITQLPHVCNERIVA